MAIDRFKRYPKKTRRLVFAARWQPAMESASLRESPTANGTVSSRVQPAHAERQASRDTSAGCSNVPGKSSVSLEKTDVALTV